MSGRVFEEKEKIKWEVALLQSAPNRVASKPQWGKFATVWAGEGRGREGGN
jgi:hypothetical protein